MDKIVPNRKKAIFLARRHLSELVYDAVNLEGINYTLPEVQTLLDGITVGGHKLTDQIITLNQANAWKFLFKIIENDQFELTKKIACNIHEIAGKEEALEWGKFRTGAVTIAGTDYMPPEPMKLDVLWDNLIKDLDSINNVIDQGIFLFLHMARNQFFFDVNKRMGRFMMNGWLLQNGYPVINVPAKKQEEFNKLMIEFYPDGNVADMTAFMKSCIDHRVIKIMGEE